MDHGFFYRNQPITLSRCRDILKKISERGCAWMLARLVGELTLPETAEGRTLRRGLVPLWGAMTTAVAIATSPFLRWLGHRGKTLYYFFDLEVCPVTFDIFDYLMMADLRRAELDYDNFNVVVVPGKNAGLRRESAEYAAAVGHDMRRWRIDHVVIPAFSMFPRCSGYTVCADRRQATWLRALFALRTFPSTYWPTFPLGLFPRPLLEALAARGGEFEGIRPHPQAMAFVRDWLAVRCGGKKPVVITLRQYGFETARNSSTEVWAAFARRLDPGIYQPVFVLDTTRAMFLPPSELQGFPVFETASVDLWIRAALYEAAYLNLCTTHGPTELMWFNPRVRYVLFMAVDTGGDPKTGNLSQHSLESLRQKGFPVGGQPPFAGRFQKWVWEAESVERLEQEFQSMAERIDAEEES